MEVKFQLALRRNSNCRYHRTLSFRKCALIFPVSLKTLPHSGLTEVSLCTSIQGWERNDSLHLLNLSRQESHTRCLLTARHPSSAAGWGTHSWPSPHYGQSFPEDFPPGSAPRCPSSPSKSRQTSRLLLLAQTMCCFPWTRDGEHSQPQGCPPRKTIHPSEGFSLLSGDGQMATHPPVIHAVREKSLLFGYHEIVLA